MWEPFIPLEVILSVTAVLRRRPISIREISLPKAIVHEEIIEPISWPADSDLQNTPFGIDTELRYEDLPSKSRCPTLDPSSQKEQEPSAEIGVASLCSCSRRSEIVIVLCLN